MSENTNAIFQVKITGVADFRAVAPVFGVTVSDGPGAMPKRQLLVKVREAVKAGKATLIETDYFGVDAILNPTAVKGGKRSTVAYEISYRVVNADTGKVDGPVQTITVDKDKIKSLIPDASLQGAKLNGVIALVMVAHFEGASIAELPNYVVTNVVRVDAESAVPATDDAPKGDDASEGDTDADKAPEDGAKVEETPAVVAAPVEVKVATKPRTRKSAKVKADA